MRRHTRHITQLASNFRPRATVDALLPPVIHSARRQGAHISNVCYWPLLESGMGSMSDRQGRYAWTWMQMIAIRDLAGTSEASVCTELPIEC